MTEGRLALTAHFRMLLLTVVGQAFMAAGYQLDDNAVQQAGGRFRFVRSFDSGLYGFIGFELLAYTENGCVSRMRSRSRVTLTRSDRPPPQAPSGPPPCAQRTPRALVAADFGAAILPATDHRWTFRNTDALGRALAGAGHLIAGYGIPWLA